MKVRNTFIIFLVSGFWHGAAWQYIIWGGLHGAAIGYEIMTKSTRDKILSRFPKAVASFIGLVFTFGFVCFTDIFFRANTVQDAFYMIGKLGDIPAEIGTILSTHKFAFLNLPNLYNFVYPGAAVIIFLEAVNFFSVKYSLKEHFGNRPTWLRWSIYYSAVLLLLFYGVYEKHQFIYFQF